MKLFPSITTIPIVVAGIMTGVSVTDAATVGSSIVFSGSVFGSLTQMDYIDPAIAPLAPSPNVEGSFQVLDATGSFSPALTVPASIGTIRDFSSGGFPGVITRAGPFLNGSDDPNFYIPNFLRLTVPGSVDFTFRLETVIRSVVIDPNSDPLDPTISSISATLTGTVTDLITNEVQAAVGTFIPEIPPNSKASAFTPDNFFGPSSYTGSLQVIAAPTSQSVPEPRINVGLTLLGFLGIAHGINRGRKSIERKFSDSKS